ncbi:MAG: glycosyltransferase [Acidobacteriota bacterium]|nr:glycosyltransferase [Acidobacteriota bacterium]
MPKVTVIIPAYNAEKFIEQTINSVLAQTFQDFEIIVIDDGSKDKTAEIINSYGFLVRCIQTTNGGVSRARNLGIDNALGEYIAFLDSDDLWEPTKLEKQVALLDENPNIGLCFTALERVDRNLKLIGKTEAQNYPDFCEALLLYSCVVTGSCSSVMLRTEIAKQTGGFDTNFTNHEDWEYWLQLSLITEFAPISEYLVKYRTVEGSASFNNPAVIESNVKGVLNKFFAAPQLPEKYCKLRNKSYSNNWLILSGEYLHAKQYADSLRCLWNALRLYPQNITRPLGLPIRWTKRLLTSNV